MTDVMFGKEYIVKVTEDGECVTVSELTRCNACKFYKHMECQHIYGLLHADENDYCSYAERKDDGTHD